MEVDSVDRISGLPDFVIHAILALLPVKDAVRTSVLSKRWNRVRETFPYLIFDQYICTNKLPEDASEPTRESIQRIGSFLGIVKRALLRSTRCGARGIMFALRTELVPEVSSEFDKCFELALRSDATWIHISRLGSSRVVLPETVFVSNPFQYRFLRKLYLSGIRFSETSMNDVFQSCPNIGSLSLLHITGVGKLEIRKLDRLERVLITSAKDLGVCIFEAPRLRIFYLENLHPRVTCTLDLTARCLRELSLDNISITDEWLHSLITLCPLLEDLGIHCCKLLRKVTISAMHLTSLVLNICNEIEAVEIDAPALSSFKHDSEALPRLIMKTIPAELEIVHSLISANLMNTSRFVDLRNFLTVSTLTGCLTVRVYNPQQAVSFGLEELLELEVPPAFQLQHLKLEFFCLINSSYMRAMIDGLLWSCHPKTISTSLSDPMFLHCRVLVLNEMLLEAEKNLTCCGSARAKCWRHGLKSATDRSFADSDGGNPVIRFDLEWDNDSIW